MLIRKYTDEGVKFSLKRDTDDQLIPINDWQESDGAFYISSLQSLVDNGSGEKDEYSYLIPYIALYELDVIEREMLDLPSLYPYEIYIQQDGLITRPDFKYTVSYCSFAPNGNRFVLNSRCGSIIGLDIQDYMLTKEQYDLISAIEEFNALPSEQKETNENLKSFANIKELSISSAAILDEYLRDKNVVLPNRVKIDIRYQDDVLEVIPTIEDECGEKFSYNFDRFREVRDNYPVTQPDGTKTHVVITPKQKRGASKSQAAISQNY
ncbi:MAG: hypothetical protein SNH27_14390 [Rikenellaceae bacterium]